MVVNLQLSERENNLHSFHFMYTVNFKELNQLENCYSVTKNCDKITLLKLILRNLQCSCFVFGAKI